MRTPCFWVPCYRTLPIHRYPMFGLPCHLRIAQIAVRHNNLLDWVSWRQVCLTLPNCSNHPPQILFWILAPHIGSSVWVLFVKREENISYLFSSCSQGAGLIRISKMNYFTAFKESTQPWLLIFITNLWKRNSNFFHIKE